MQACRMPQGMTFRTIAPAGIPSGVGARPHPLGRLQDSQLEEVRAIVGQIPGLVL